MNDISLERTGRLYSFSSVEWQVRYPDGTLCSIWSPPWSDLDYYDPLQDERAVVYARTCWREWVDATAYGC